MEPTFAIVGCGRVGSVLATGLQNIGYTPVGFASRTPEPARKLAEAAGDAPFASVPWQITGSADIVIITTPDGRIAEVCDAIAGHEGFKKKAVVLHCSGSLPSTILASAKNNGASTGSMHPLQSFASVDNSSNPFKDIIVSVEGDPEAVAVAENIASRLESKCLRIKTEAKTLYHAAAVVASNYLVTLQSFAFQLLAAAGIPEDQAFTVLGPLIKGTVGNIESRGIHKALTGPIVRGDTETVKEHLRAISEFSEEFVALYRALGQRTVPIAEKAGLSEAAAAQLLTLLSPDTEL